MTTSEELKMVLAHQKRICNFRKFYGAAIQGIAKPTGSKRLPAGILIYDRAPRLVAVVPSQTMDM